jgi:hypothetical protein
MVRVPPRRRPGRAGVGDGRLAGLHTVVMVLVPALVRAATTALLLPLLLHADAAPAATAPAGAAAARSGRGFGDGKRLGLPVDLELLSGVPWWYNWGLDPGNVPGVGSDFPQEFVAMVWGAGTVADLTDWSPHPSTKVVLGFNEPNLYSQANLTGAAACALWAPVLAAADAHGLQVGSPAANHCKPSATKPQPGVQGHACYQTPEDWFDAFFAEPGCGLDTVDFIATHKYGCNASDTIAYVKMLHDRYHKPVWLTEFSCGGATADKQLEFMRQILPVFDAMSDVIPRYAWFAARTNQQTDAQRYATLISNETDTLTTIGQWYNSTV